MRWFYTSAQCPDLCCVLLQLTLRVKAQTTRKVPAKWTLRAKPPDVQVTVRLRRDGCDGAGDGDAAPDDAQSMRAIDVLPERRVAAGVPGRLVGCSRHGRLRSCLLLSEPPQPLGDAAVA